MKHFRQLILAGVFSVSMGVAVAQDTNEVEQLRRDLQRMREQFEKSEREHREQIESLSKKLEALTTQTNVTLSVPAPGAEDGALSTGLKAGEPPAQPSQANTVGESTEVSEAIAARGPLFRSGNAYLDIGLVGTFAVGTSTADDIEGGLQLGGHDPNQRGFTVQGLEASFSGAVDPYFRGTANVLFAIDSEGDSYVELEEAWLETVSLPANLQIRAGQILTEFGRQNPSHPHTWAFVDTPLVLGRMFGPDGLRNPGARLSWLVPTPFFSEAVVTLQNSHGETAHSFRSSGHAHGDGEDEDLPFAYRHADNDRGVHHFQDVLITPRYAASFDLTDSQTVLVGASAAFGPNSRGGEDAGDTETQIYGVDLTWKWKSPSHHAGFPFVTFQSEALLRRYDAGRFDWVGEEAPVIDDSTGNPAELSGEVLTDYGFYSQILYGFKRGWVAGMRLDYVDSEAGDYEQRPLSWNGDSLGRDPQRARRWRLSPNLTWYPTEFSKVRLQYNYDDREDMGEDHSIWLQFEFLLGAHAAHKF